MHSMTGYGRARREAEGRCLTVELKSVNHRFLDVALRMPRSLSFLEVPVRRALGERLGGYKQVERVEILPYHTLGVHKYEAMGKEYRLAGVQENTPEQSERAAALFREYFPTVVVN